MSTVPLNDITANYHGGDEFSAAAHAETSQQRRDKDKARIVRAIREYGPATCQELEDRLGLIHESCSARIAELRQLRILVEVDRRPTRSGRSARVHGLADAPESPPAVAF